MCGTGDGVVLRNTCVPGVCVDFFSGVVRQPKHRLCYRIGDGLLQSIAVNPSLVLWDVCVALRWDRTCMGTTRHGTAEAFF